MNTVSNTRIRLDDDKFDMCYSDDSSNKSQINYSPNRSRKTGRPYRRKMKKKKLTNAMDRAQYMGYPKTHYVECSVVNGRWTRVGKYLQHTKNSSIRTFYKRQSNRAIRRAVSIPHKGNGCHKQYDFQWSID